MMSLVAAPLSYAPMAPVSAVSTRAASPQMAFGKAELDAASSVHHCFFMGDMNYRWAHRFLATNCLATNCLATNYLATNLGAPGLLYGRRELPAVHRCLATYCLATNLGAALILRAP